MCAASLNKGVNTFERVQNSELSEKIIKIKLRKLQKTQLYITSFHGKFLSFYLPSVAHDISPGFQDLKKM